MQEEKDSAETGAPDPLEIAPQTIAEVVGSILSGAEYWTLRAGAFGSANFEGAWQFASGNGVLVGIVDQGVNYTHLDLVDNYDVDLDYDPRDAIDALDAIPDDAFQEHGTEVAGIISGSIYNSIGTIGAAPDATVTASYIRFGSSVDVNELADALAHQVSFDVSNNSWGFTSAFSDNFNNAYLNPIADQLENAALNGRDGLGTALVFAAGNGKLKIGGQNIGDDANFHNMQNSRFVIAVGASDVEGNAAAFSSPGTNVLISGPGVGLITTGGNEVGSTKSTYVSGTSFAAPLVSSAIALMLEVNPELGYRDIQEILAITASSSRSGDATVNGATNVNGGGMVHDRELGFGTLDAEAAVKLARSWTAQSTADNEEHIGASFDLPTTFDGVSQALTVEIENPGAGRFAVDFVELSLTISDPQLKQLSIELISPNGTRADIAPNMRVAGNKTYLDFKFSSVATWGEDPAGTWTVILKHSAESADFSVLDASLDIYGDTIDENDTYYFTPSFTRLADVDENRAVLTDGNGGDDTLNFAAASAALTIDLSGASESSLGMRALTVAGAFERVIGTTFADHITGGDLSETLIGDYGADRLAGGAGDDLLSGGRGDDVMIGGSGADMFDGGDGTDTADFTAYQTSVQIDLDTGNNGGAAAGDLFFSIETFNLGSGDDTFVAMTINASITIDGGAGGDLLVGGLGSDRLDGGEGDDHMAGGDGNDTYVVSGSLDVVVEYDGEGTDSVFSTASYALAGFVERLTLVGPAAINGFGNDIDNRIVGNAARNLIDGQGGDDWMVGGRGNDVYVVDTSADLVVETKNGGVDVVRATADYLLRANVEKLILMGDAADGTGNRLANRIVGNASDNNLSGRSGTDTLFGGGGDDVLSGGAGRDRLWGDAGSDAFVFNTAPKGLAQSDVIFDFRHGVDKIHLDNAVFKGVGGTGRLAASHFVKGPAALDSNDRIVYDRASGTLSYDADGAGARMAIDFAKLANKAYLTASDFVVI